MLRKTRGAKAEAARRLGFSKSDLSYKLVNYGIGDPDLRGNSGATPVIHA